MSSSLFPDLTWRQITFTPGTADWYRIMDETGPGGQISGMFRLSGLDGGGKAWSAMVVFNAEGSAGAYSTLTQLFCTSIHVVDIVRTSCDGASHSALDIHIATGMASLPVTVDFMCYTNNNPITSPTVATSLGTDTQLFINQAGLRTTDMVTQGSVLSKMLKTNSGGDLIAATAGTDYSTRVTVPASATASGVAGNWAGDASAFYYCYSTNTWRKILSSTF